MKFLIQCFVTAIALAVTASFLDGIMVDGFAALLRASIIIGLVNAFVRPVLRLITLPINLLTLGLFHFVLNGVLLYMVSWFSPGFHIAGVVTAIVGSLAMSLIAYILYLVLDVRRKDR